MFLEFGEMNGNIKPVLSDFQAEECGFSGYLGSPPVSTGPGQA